MRTADIYGFIRQTAGWSGGPSGDQEARTGFSRYLPDFLLHEVNGKLMKTEHLELRKRVEDFSLDDPNSAFPFTERLARDNAWRLPYARRVAREYKRFAFLAAAAGHPVSPSDQVDQAWHLHMIYTESYWQRFCGEALRRPLHHHPTRGGADERAKFNDWYARTLASYRVLFDEEPPTDIWPDASRRLGEDTHFVRVNASRNWIIPKPACFSALKNLGALFRAKARMALGLERARVGVGSLRDGLWLRDPWLGIAFRSASR